MCRLGRPPVLTALLFILVNLSTKRAASYDRRRKNVDKFAFLDGTGWQCHGQSHPVRSGTLGPADVLSGRRTVRYQSITTGWRTKSGQLRLAKRIGNLLGPEDGAACGCSAQFIAFGTPERP